MTGDFKGTGPGCLGPHAPSECRGEEGQGPAAWLCPYLPPHCARASVTWPGWAVQQGPGTEMSPCQHPQTSASGWRTQGCLPSATAVSEGDKGSPSAAPRSQGTGSVGSWQWPPVLRRSLEQLQEHPSGHTNPSFLLMARKLLFLANELKASVIFPRKHDKEKHRQRLCVGPSPRLAEL